VPGLIEGASEGRGLGLEFLRHVERCEALLHVLDCATLEPGRDPLSDLDVILAELDAYEVPEGQTPLTQRPAIVALNKIDVPDGRELAEFVRPELEERGFKVMLVSTVSHEGLRELGFALGEIVEAARERRVDDDQHRERIVIRPKAVDENDFTIRVEGGTWGDIYRILGRKPERWVAQTDFANDEAVGYLADRLAKLGLEDALVAKGAQAGSTVVIGPGDGMIFDWEPTLSSAAEVMTARGTDIRFEERTRRTTKERRDDYYKWMDAKASARAELEQEREAGLWRESDEAADSPENSR
jgi:GTP-binding protein